MCILYMLTHTHAIFTFKVKTILHTLRNVENLVISILYCRQQLVLHT